ncbi:hypothetical protein GK48_26400 [Salmonella enterica subsp. diarizonae]|nr:hypothetical protein [Salmonella enterica subsp. diarizonae]
MGTAGISGITLQQDYITIVNVCTENDEALYQLPQGVGTVEKLFLFVCCSIENTITASSLQVNSMMVLLSVIPGMKRCHCGIPSGAKKARHTQTGHNEHRIKEYKWTITSLIQTTRLSS